MMSGISWVSLFLHFIMEIALIVLRTCTILLINKLPQSLFEGERQSFDSAVSYINMHTITIRGSINPNTNDNASNPEDNDYLNERSVVFVDPSLTCVTRHLYMNFAGFFFKTKVIDSTPFRPS